MGKHNHSSAAGEFAERLRDIATRAGAVDAACLTPAFFDPAPLDAAFDAWFQRGNNGERLPYVRKNCELRKSPFKSRPWATAAVVVTFRNAWNVPAVADPEPVLPRATGNTPSGRVAAYAAGPDYHKTGRGILDNMARELDPDASHRMEAAVDTAPVPDTFLALAAGLGLRGTNGLLRTSQFGCRVFVGTLFTDLPLPPVLHTPGHPVPVCTDCLACIHACPTAALASNHPITVERCRSFLSMEYRGAFDARQIRLLGNALFGCDECTGACPPSAEYDSGIDIDLFALLRMPSNQIKRRIHGTALEYAGATLLKRNAIANLANSADPAARAAICELRKSTRSDIIARTAAAALD